MLQLHTQWHPRRAGFVWRMGPTTRGSRWCVTPPAGRVRPSYLHGQVGKTEKSEQARRVGLREPSSGRGTYVPAATGNPEMICHQNSLYLQRQSTYGNSSRYLAESSSVLTSQTLSWKELVLGKRVQPIGCEFGSRKCINEARTALRLWGDFATIINLVIYSYKAPVTNSSSDTVSSWSTRVCL